MEGLIVLVFLGIISSCIAHTKGRSVIGWFFAGFFLHIIGILIVAVLPNLNEQRRKEEAMERENRRLREQLVQEQIKSEAFRRHAAARLDAHDQHLSIDTRSAATALPEEAAPLALPEFGAPGLPEASLNGENLLLQPGQDVQPPADGQQAAMHSMAEPLPSAANQPKVTSSRQWYFEVLGKARGPVSDRDLLTLAESGQINESTLVWTEQLGDWKPAGSIKALKSRLQS